MAQKTKKPFYKSKTKWAGMLTALGLVLPPVISVLNGADFSVVMAPAYEAVVILLGVFGIRDAIKL